MDFIKIVNEAFATGKSHPAFRSGDTITVDYRISEGGKERIQRYRGVVIRISGHGDKKRFTVRKISEGVGVERIFTIESPFIEKITVEKFGKVRRAKLYYLRALTGKKARIKERRYVAEKKEDLGDIFRFTADGCPKPSYQAYSPIADTLGDGADACLSPRR